MSRDRASIRSAATAAFLCAVACGIGVLDARPFAEQLEANQARFAVDAAGTRLPSAARRDVRLFRTAVEHLAAGRFDEAIAYLQTVLDTEMDGFFEPESGGARLMSLRAEAIRQIEALPQAARKAYEDRYGPAAGGILREAIAERDSRKLAEVARRFPATVAGREAAYRIAAEHFDRGEALAAAARLESLRSGWSKPASAELLARLAACYALLGDEQRLENVRRELATLKEDLRIGGDRFLPVELAARESVFADLAEGLEGSRNSWPVAGGSAARTSFRVASVGPATTWEADALPDPFLTWQAALSPAESRLRRWAAQTALLEDAAGRPVVPVSQMVAGGETIFFRTPANLVAVDATNGRVRWRSLADPLAWDYLTGQVPETPEGEIGGRLVVGQRLWSDATWGTLATDGRIVFGVEESGAAGPLPPISFANRDETIPQPIPPPSFNRLVAYDVSTGRRLWEAGGPAGERSPLAGVFFLGPPVPVGSQWFVLGEERGATRLYALDPHRTESLLWALTVAEQDVPIEESPARRTSGASPCVAGGLLVCPVGGDLVVTVDPATRMLLWANATRRAKSGEQGLDAVVPDAGMEVMTRPFEALSIGRFVLIARPQHGIDAVDSLDGSLQWSVRDTAGLWMIGSDGQRVFLQAATGLLAHDVASGAPAWKAPAVLGAPSGRGVIVGDRVYLPLTDATLAVLDATTGGTLTTHATPRDEPLGNLAIVGGTLVSQSASRLVAMPLTQ